MSKTIEQKYQEMDEVSHILNRPGMYVGSTKEEEKDMFIYNGDREEMEMWKGRTEWGGLSHIYIQQNLRSVEQMERISAIVLGQRI